MNRKGDIMDLDELIDRLDAHVFTGDTFHDDEKRKNFKEYLDRWARGLVSIEQVIEDVRREEEVMRKSEESENDD